MYISVWQIWLYVISVCYMTYYYDLYNVYLWHMSFCFSKRLYDIYTDTNISCIYIYTVYISIGYIISIFIHSKLHVWCIFVIDLYDYNMLMIRFLETSNHCFSPTSIHHTWLPASRPATSLDCEKDMVTAWQKWQQSNRRSFLVMIPLRCKILRPWFQWYRFKEPKELPGKMFWGMSLWIPWVHVFTSVARLSSKGI